MVPLIIVQFISSDHFRRIFWGDNVVDPGVGCTTPWGNMRANDYLALGVYGTVRLITIKLFALVFAPGTGILIGTVFVNIVGWIFGFMLFLYTININLGFYISGVYDMHFVGLR